MNLSAVGNLPAPMKIGAAVAGGAGALTVVKMVGGTEIAALLASGLIVVALLTVGYKKVTKWRAKVKAAPLLSKVSENAKAAPQGVADAAGRARLDELRKKFESGIAEFRKAGKDLYTLPWYMLIGEPGSGKTEAIRHAQLPFPQGMNDPLQGSGGTVNMDWWFTNKAIVLDTAGRFVFEQVEAGSTGEWKEFLKLLRTYRRDCPINGLVLVIPVDTLIKDTADEIERKAGKIARQLDVIQRALDVRFPVFVLVTKSDMIYGFREFFETLDDPQLQHQILGWSNPTDRDTPFDPSLVQQHLDQVRGRLMRRRMSLLLDPAHTQNAVDGRRVDEVDAMYAFPESLAKIGPRLRRYLEMIFVAGEWSSKPLFLRGIYFTSSMRKGDALDAELAEALGIGVEELPEGKVFHEERAFFLRDLFLDKVFKERGLVTRSVNTRGLQRRRKLIALSSSFAVVVALIAMTGFGWWLLEKSVGERVAEWEPIPDGVKDKGLDALSVASGGSYWKDTQTFLGDRSLADYFAARAEGWASEEVKTPGAFKATASIAGVLHAKPPEPMRREAIRAMFEARVLLPAAMSSAQTLTGWAKDGTWHDHGPEAAQALAQLVRISSCAAGGKDARVEIDPLMKLSLSPDAYTAYQSDERAKLQKAYDVFFGAGEADGAWKEACARLTENSGVDLAAREGLRAFAESWEARATDRGPELGALLALRTALTDLARAEQDLQALKDVASGAKPGDMMVLGPGGSFSMQWGERFARVKEAHDRAMAHAVIFGDHPTFAAAHAATIEALKQEAAGSFEAMLASLPETSKGSDLGWDAESLGKKRDEVTAKIGAWITPDATKAIEKIDAERMAAIGPGGGRAFAIRFAEMYEPAHAVLARQAPPAATLENYLEENAAIEKGVADAKRRAGDAPGPDLRDASLFMGAGEVCDRALDIATRQQQYLLIAAVLADRDRADAPDLYDLVKSTAEASSPPKELVETMPMGISGVVPNAGFSPEAAARIVGAWQSIKRLLDGGSASVLDAETLAGQHERIDPAALKYIDDYYTYWTSDFVAALGPKPMGSWAEYRSAFTGGSMSLRALRAAVPEAQQRAEQALTAMTGMLPEGDARLKTVGAYRTASARFVDDISKASFGPTFDALLSGFEGLPESGVDARRALLKMSPREFWNVVAGELYDEAEEGEVNSLGQAYINRLVLEGLSRIEQDCRVEADKRLAGLLERGGKFPLAKDADADEALTPAELKAVWLDIQELRPASPASTPRTIGEGATLAGSPRLGEHLKLLRDTARLSGAKREWFDKVAMSVEALVGGSGEPTASIYHLGRAIAGIPAEARGGTTPGAVLATGDELKYLRLVWTSGTRDSTKNFNATVQDPTEVRKGFPIGASMLEVRMGKQEEDVSDDPPASASLGVVSFGRWSLLPSLLRSGVWWAPDPAIPGSPMWLVPIELRPTDAGDTKRWWYVLGVSTPGALTKEAVEAWPTLELWKRANEAR